MTSVKVRHIPTGAFMKAYDQYLKMGIAIFCALCLPANALACEADKADFSTLEYLYSPTLSLEIKEGNDELVDQLRSAAEQGTVEIGNPSWWENTSRSMMEDPISISAGMISNGGSRGHYYRLYSHPAKIQKPISKGCMMKVRCAFCGNKELQSRRTQYIYRRDNQFLIVDDVPCLQCVYCGEQYFEGNVLRDIEVKFNELHLYGQKASKEVRIPVEHFSDLHQV